MTFLPIVACELRVRSRSRGTYWWRCGAALVVSGVAAVMMMLSLVTGPGRIGSFFFTTLSWLGWFFCLMEGIRQAADCLSQEKREGTLGLLFLTDLRAYDVVLGKFVGVAPAAFFSLLAALPVLGLAQTLGGVTAGEFWRMCLALLNTLFFTLTASLWVSSIVREERRAWLGAIVVNGFFVVVLPLANAIPGWVGSLLQGMSPYTPFRLAFASSYARGPASYWGALFMVHLIGWLWLVLAVILLPRSW